MAAYDEDRLVGLIRVVGDGLTIVFIQDLLVYPQYQRQGDWPEPSSADVGKI